MREREREYNCGKKETNILRMGKVEWNRDRRRESK